MYISDHSFRTKEERRSGAGGGGGGGLLSFFWGGATVCSGRGGDWGCAQGGWGAAMLKASNVFGCAARPKDAHTPQRHLKSPCLRGGLLGPLLCRARPAP